MARAHLFALRQALEAYAFTNAISAATDRSRRSCARSRPNYSAGPHPGRKINVRHNAPAITNLMATLEPWPGLRRDLDPRLESLGWMKLTGKWHRFERLGTRIILRPGLDWPAGIKVGGRRVVFRGPSLSWDKSFGASSLSQEQALALGGFYRRIKGRARCGRGSSGYSTQLAVPLLPGMTRGLE